MSGRVLFLNTGLAYFGNPENVLASLSLWAHRAPLSMTLNEYSQCGRSKSGFWIYLHISIRYYYFTAAALHEHSMNPAQIRNMSVALKFAPHGFGLNGMISQTTKIYVRIDRSMALLYWCLNHIQLSPWLPATTSGWPRKSQTDNRFNA